jgi:DNA modification methylase
MEEAKPSSEGGRSCIGKEIDEKCNQAENRRCQETENLLTSAKSINDELA